MLLSNARFSASLRPWSLRTFTAAGSRSWSSTCHTPGPVGSAQDASRQRPSAEQASGPASLKSVRHQSTCSSSTGSSRKAQQRQQTQVRRPQPQQDELQQQWRQQTQMGHWPEASDIIKQQDDKQVFQGGVVTPMERTPLWHATYYGNVPSRWLPKDSGSKITLPQTSASQSSCRRDSKTGNDGAIGSNSSSSSSAQPSSSQDEANVTRSADQGNYWVYGSRNATNTASGGIPSWDALVSSSSSAISSLFRVSQYPQPQPYWRDGELCYGNKPTVLVQTSPAAEFNRAARSRLMQRLRPLYPGSSSSIRVAYAERSARAVRRKQRQAARQEQQQQLDNNFSWLLQLYQHQVLGEIEGFRTLASDWKWLVKRAQNVDVLLKHKPTNMFACMPIDTTDVQQQRLVRALELGRRHLAAQRQKQQRQQRFRLRSHSSAVAAATVLLKETYPERKQLLLQEPAVGRQLEGPADNAFDKSFFGLALAASEIPRVSKSTREEAERYLASYDTVHRCAAQRDKQGEVLPMPRHCIPGYCSICSDDINSSSSSCVSQRQQQQQVGAVVSQQQQQQQQQRRQRRSKSACVAGVGCDAIVKRGRKRTSRARRQSGWWVADLLKFRQTFSSASNSKLDADEAAVLAGAAVAVEAPVAAAEAMLTPTSTSTVDFLQAQQQQQQHYGSSPGSSNSFSGTTNFVMFEECESDASDWDNESDDDSDYESDSDSENDMSDDEANELLCEEDQLSPEAQWALEEPYVFRNSIGVIYGFWSKCPMG